MIDSRLNDVFREMKEVGRYLRTLKNTQAKNLPACLQAAVAKTSSSESEGRLVLGFQFERYLLTENTSVSAEKISFSPLNGKLSGIHNHINSANRTRVVIHFDQFLIRTHESVNRESRLGNISAQNFRFCFPNQVALVY